LELVIVAPALDNYTYDVLYASHSIQGYPVDLRTGWEYSTVVRCADESEFEAALAGILSAPQLKSVMQALLAQSRASD
jgi:hypothetical protein